jgi:hypothetical protein
MIRGYQVHIADVTTNKGIIRISFYVRQIVGRGARIQQIEIHKIVLRVFLDLVHLYCLKSV